MEEVQKVVCSMSADSAPGPDGFPGSFFQGYHKRRSLPAGHLFLR